MMVGMLRRNEREAETLGGAIAMRFNNNSLSEVHVQMALYIHMPQGFPRTRFLITVVDGWIWSVFGSLSRELEAGKRTGKISMTALCSNLQVPPLQANCKHKCR